MHRPAHLVFQFTFFLSTFKVFFQCNFFFAPTKRIKLMKICRKKQIPLLELSKMLVILFCHVIGFFLQIFISFITSSECKKKLH